MSERRAPSLFSLLPDPKLSGDGSEASIVCPWCGRRKLYVNLYSALWICFRCGIAGNRTSLARDVLGIDSLPSVPAGRISRPSPPVPVVRLPEEARPLDNPDSRFQAPFWEYLRGRGVEPALIYEYRMHFALSGRYRWRVIVPVTWHERCCGFVARAIRDDLHPKTLNSEGTMDIPFNLDRMAGRQRIVLVEGVFDALRMPNMAVATLGARLSVRQREAIASLRPESVCIMRDGDEAGRKQTLDDARSLLAAGLRVFLAALPDGVDPASATPTTLWNALRSAPEVSLGITNAALKRIWERTVRNANRRDLTSLHVPARLPTGRKSEHSSPTEAEN